MSRIVEEGNTFGSVKNIKSAKNIDKLFKRSPQEFVAEKMASLRMEMDKKNTEREAEKKADEEKYFDQSFPYSNTLADFQEQLKVDKECLSRKELLQQLRKYKAVYGNSHAYYIKWGGVVADEHMHIYSLIKETLSELLQKKETTKNSNKKETKSRKDYTYRQAALYHSYAGDTLNYDNAAIAIKKEKYIAINDEKRFVKEFQKWNKTGNRIKNGSAREINSRLKDIELVAKNFKGKDIAQKIKEEINSLKKILNPNMHLTR
jgi:hypothetical protein